MEDSGHSVVEAKKIYTQQLSEILTPLLYTGIKSIFDTCKEPTNKIVLITFQEKLCSVIKWNQDIIDKEFQRIVDQSNNKELLDKLIEAIFISNIKVLSSVAQKSNGILNIKIPETKNLIHKCYIECARYFYEDPSLMDDREINLNNSEIQRNIKRSQLAINICIEKTIQNVLPLQEILENYLAQNSLENNTDETPEQVGGISFPSEDNNGSDDNNGSNDVSNEEEDNGESNNDGDNEGDDDPFMEETSTTQPDLTVSDGNDITDTPVYSDIGGHSTNTHDTYNTTNYNGMTQPLQNHQEDVKKIILNPSNVNQDDTPFFSDEE
jgi:hypothetical protein